MIEQEPVVLLVDDNWPDVEPLLTGLPNSIPILTESRADQAIARLEEHNRIAVVLLDLVFENQEMQGEQVYDSISQRYPKLPIIVLSGSKDIGLALRLSQGSGGKKRAYFYFVKDQLDRQQLTRTVENAVAWYQLQRNQTRQTDQGDIISLSPSMDEVLGQVARAAEVDLPVLILGESGVGKELIARAIHKNSKRGNKAFIPVNCGALPENLVEGELFGTVRGAFTGAVDKKGAFERAQGGSLYLDEIGEMPISQQPKLLRSLENREIQRIGAQRTTEIDARIVASTNRNLLSAIAAKEFREDLYYRLDVFRIEVPPLRERPEDIPLLIEYFINRFRPGVTMNSDALETLISHSWPGNVRELENALKRAFASSVGDSIDARSFEKLGQSAHAKSRNQNEPWVDRIIREEAGWVDLTTEFKLGSQAIKNILMVLAERWKKKHGERISGDDLARLLRTNRNHVNQILKQHGLKLRSL